MKKRFRISLGLKISFCQKKVFRMEEEEESVPGRKRRVHLKETRKQERNSIYDNAKKNKRIRNKRNRSEENKELALVPIENDEIVQNKRVCTTATSSIQRLEKKDSKKKIFIRVCIYGVLYLLSFDVNEKDMCYYYAFSQSHFSIFSHYGIYSDCVNILNQVLIPLRYAQNTSSIIKFLGFLIINTFF